VAIAFPLRSLPFGNLFGRLLLHPSPLLPSPHLRPTRLTPEEDAFFERQIARCEEYAQRHLAGFSKDVPSLRPTLPQQAHLHEQRLIRTWCALSDDAACLTVDIASPEAIPENLASSVGYFISEPAPLVSQGDSSGGDLARYLSGGYEHVVRNNDPAARAPISTLGMELPAVPMALLEKPRLLHLCDRGEVLAAFHFPQPTLEARP